MNSAEKWGSAFLLLGILIFVFMSRSSLVPALGWSLPLIVLGLVLIIFRNRESKIEKD